MKTSGARNRLITISAWRTVLEQSAHRRTLMTATRSGRTTITNAHRDLAVVILKRSLSSLFRRPSPPSSLTLFRFQLPGNVLVTSTPFVWAAQCPPYTVRLLAYRRFICVRIFKRRLLRSPARTGQVFASGVAGKSLSRSPLIYAYVHMYKPTYRNKLYDQ